jgi:hypothetical protein
VAIVGYGEPDAAHMRGSSATRKLVVPTVWAFTLDRPKLRDGQRLRFAVGVRRRRAAGGNPALHPARRVKGGRSPAPANP